MTEILGECQCRCRCVVDRCGYSIKTSTDYDRNVSFELPLVLDWLATLRQWADGSARRPTS